MSDVLESIPTATEINEENLDLMLPSEHSDEPSVMIVETRMIAPLSYLEDVSYPIKIVCPNCDVYNTTTVDQRVPPSAYLFSGFFLLFFWPFMCLPFCTMKEYSHHCSVCDIRLC